MTTHLFIAPPAHGKTEAMLRRAQAKARTLESRPILCVPTVAQASSTRHRLMAMGGAMGVRILTFDELYEEVLRSSNETYVELTEPVQYRLMLAVVRQLDREGAITHYHPLAEMPGFIAVTRKLVAELKNAQIDPDELMRVWEATDAPNRLRELATIYQAWQSRLQDSQWADRAGMGWLAVEALEQGRTRVPESWSPLIFDGFDSLTGIQLSLVRALHEHHTGDLWITLTGDPDDRGAEPRRRAFLLFHETRLSLESALAIQGEALPLDETRPHVAWQPALHHLQQSLFESDALSVPADDGIEMVEASTRALEAREALRWVKERILADRMAPTDCAILCRNLGPYRTYLDTISREFDVPIVVQDGLPLARNPAVAAILQMLRVMERDAKGEPWLLRRDVVSLWQSPYFDWEGCGVQAGDAELLDQAARKGLVKGGGREWREALSAFGNVDALAATTDEYEDVETRRSSREAGPSRLLGAFECFVQRITPPPLGSHKQYVRWLEDRLSDAAPATLFDPATGQPTIGGLSILRRACEGDDVTAARDCAALSNLQTILEGLVHAEEVVNGQGEFVFEDFVAELSTAVDSATFKQLTHFANAVFVGTFHQARGLPFRAVAVLGMAEGETPEPLREDPFLRDDDRLALRGHFAGLGVPTKSAERERFLEVVTRPTERLLLTRPRLADDGAPWKASPYWSDVRARVSLEERSVRIGQPVASGRAATAAELMEAHVTAIQHEGAAQIEARQPGLIEAVRHAAHILDMRQRRSASPFDGDLRGQAADFAARFGLSHAWSPSSIETWRDCHFRFLASKVMGLEERADPEDGISPAQLGNIYHDLFKAVYDRAEVPSDLESLLRALEVEGPRVLVAAPRRGFFRPPPGWRQIQTEITENVRRALEVLSQTSVTNVLHEVEFRDDKSVTVFTAADDSFLITGRIDRIDTLQDGSLRVIDYKSARSGYSSSDLTNGSKLQIPLYALAAEAINPGLVVTEGFYFLIPVAEQSSLTLSGYTGGKAGALETAVRFAWEAVRGARDGDFTPAPPVGGCPEYCPAAAFCWHYDPKGY